MIAGVASALGPMGVLVALRQSLCDVLENALGPVGVLVAWHHPFVMSWKILSGAWLRMCSAL